MSRLTKGLAAIALLAAGTLAAGSASATPSVPSRDAIGTGSSAIDTAGYVYGGHRYCWYVDGWHGPGWYRCGYSWRRGLGWGSAVWGWNNWVWSGPRYRRGYVFRHARPYWYRGGPRLRHRH